MLRTHIVQVRLAANGDLRQQLEDEMYRKRLALGVERRQVTGGIPARIRERLVCFGLGIWVTVIVLWVF